MLLILEDDIFVSPYLFEYLAAVHYHYSDDPNSRNLAGIATHFQGYKCTNIQMYKCTNVQTYKHANLHTNIQNTQNTQKHTQTHTNTHKHTHKKTQKKTHKQNTQPPQEYVWCLSLKEYKELHQHVTDPWYKYQITTTWGSVYLFGPLAGVPGVGGAAQGAVQ